MTDVTEQRRAEAALRRQATFVMLSREVAATANQAVGVTEAVSAILRLVCVHTGWPVGHALLLDRATDEQPPSSLWYLADAGRFGKLRDVSDATPYPASARSGTCGRRASRRGSPKRVLRRLGGRLPWQVGSRPV